MLDSPLGGALTAVVIGLLLGLEREHSQKGEEGIFAGIRTFPILALAGYLAARAGEHGAPWTLAAVLLAVGALAVVAYLRGGSGAGTTTEFTALLAPLLGALVAWGEAGLAAALGIVVTVLLAAKRTLHRLAGAVTEDEIVAILKFATVAVILVPLLPDVGMGPHDALVPRRVGIVVVVLSALSLGGYLLVRLLGSRSGWPLAGLMGGLASSTAVTLSLSSRAREGAATVRPLAVGIILASTVLYVRVLLLVGVFDADLAWYLAPRLLALTLCGVLFGWAGYRRLPSDGHAAEAHFMKNPAELGKALTLGILFSAIVVGARMAEARFGAGGLWATGAIGGLVDVDSVAVATADLRRQGLVSIEAAGGAVLLATLANLVLKGGAILAIGRLALWRRAASAFLALGAVTALLLALGWVAV